MLGDCLKDEMLAATPCRKYRGRRESILSLRYAAVTRPVPARYNDSVENIVSSGFEAHDKVAGDDPLESRPVGDWPHTGER